jgi:hypothetical protein
MRSLRAAPFVAVACAACVTAPRRAPTPYRDLLDPVDMVRALNDPESTETYGRLATVEMLTAVPLTKFAQLRGQIHRTQGKLVGAKLLHREPLEGGGEQILVEASYHSGKALGFTLSLDAKGRLAGLLVQPMAALKGATGPADAYRSHIAYGLPLLGEWTVGNGGREPRQNNHIGNAQQWYAYDLLRTDAAGHSCPDESKGNAGCLAFGQEVVAPADGVVTFTADGIPDNAAPGELDEYFVPGNTIGIDHGGGEFSFLCHLEAGSFRVHAGDHVTKGQPLAKVGNSGHSSEPHLHWHLGTDMRIGLGHGLPIRFGPLLVNGKRVEAAQPVQNDRIEERTGTPGP